ncbi:hypothetical protein ACFHW2_23530 [Actinomadura sp. LOL_016]|uniref:D-alanyl-D-alanine carboxypeptidase family protein n=1 Tax=unclassified Actinomadura TaxID=2626254 RepID=UPI003A7F6788
MTDTPDTPKTADPDDRAPARTPTAEFRLPDVTKTREDIAVRRPEATSTRADPLPVPPESDEADDEPEDPDTEAEAEPSEEPSEPAPKDATPADPDDPDDAPDESSEPPEGTSGAPEQRDDAPNEAPEPHDDPPSEDERDSDAPDDPSRHAAEQSDAPDEASEPRDEDPSADDHDGDEAAEPRRPAPKRTRTSDEPPVASDDATPPAPGRPEGAPSEAPPPPSDDEHGDAAAPTGQATASERRDDAPGGPPPHTTKQRDNASEAPGTDGRGGSGDVAQRTRASDQHPVTPQVTTPATRRRDDAAGGVSGPHPVVSGGGVPGTGVAPTREVPLVPVALPEVHRGGVSEGEGLVRFMGYEPSGDVTRQDMPQVADEPRGRRAWPWVVVAVLVVVMAVVTAQLLRPVPEPELRLTIAAEHTFPGAAPVLPWPGSGQSAVFVEGLGMMGASGGARSAPTASVAKVMTAFVYLREHPLRAGEPGPTMTVSPEGVAQMPARRQRGESLLGITAGQRLTQRKALEALMIISANDVAHELAKWDSGTVQAFVAKMNAAARELGMTGTTYTDPSGYDAGTLSTAADQVKLLRAAMEIPAFAEIVNQRSYTPANGGAVREGGNFLLGQFGVVGGKTGFTDAAGGNFVFAARKDVAGVRTLIVGAVMGQETASAAGAVSAAGELVQAAEGALTSATVAAAGARVAVVDDGLGGTAPVRAAAPVTVVGWPGLTVGVEASGDPPAEAAAGAETGTLTAGAARVPLRFADAYDGPAVVDRLTRIG